MKQDIFKKILVSSLVFFIILASFELPIFSPKIANAQLLDSGNFTSNGGNGNMMPGASPGLGARAGANIQLGEIATSIADCGGTFIKTYIFDRVAMRIANRLKENAKKEAEDARTALDEAKKIINRDTINSAGGAIMTVVGGASSNGESTKADRENIIAGLQSHYDTAVDSVFTITGIVATIKATYNDSDQLTEAENALKEASSDAGEIKAYLIGAKTTKESVDAGLNTLSNQLDQKVPTNDESTRESLGSYLKTLITKENDTKIELVKTQGKIEKTRKQQERYTLKKSCVDAVASALAKTILRQITIKTVNWINSGFDGNPFYADNIPEFLADIGKNEIIGFVSTFDKDSARFPFGKSAAIEIINNFNHSYFERNAAFTLNNVVREDVIKNFYSNFSVGGWNHWISLTQFPQNNPIGFRMMASDELVARTAGAFDSIAERAKDELAYYSGFLGMKACVKSLAPNEKYLPPAGTSNGVYSTSATFANGWTELDYKNDISKQEAIMNDTSDTYTFDEKKAAEKVRDNNLAHICAPDGIQTQTPGTFIANQLNQVVTNSPLHQLEIADDLNDSLAAIFDALLNQAVTSGIRSLKGSAGSDSWVQGIAGVPDADNLTKKDQNDDGSDLNKYKSFSFTYYNGGDSYTTVRLEWSKDKSFPSYSQLKPTYVSNSVPVSSLALDPGTGKPVNWINMTIPMDNTPSWFVRARACGSGGCPPTENATGTSNVIEVNGFSETNWGLNLALSPEIDVQTFKAQAGVPTKHYATFTYKLEPGGINTTAMVQINSKPNWSTDPNFPVKTLYDTTIHKTGTSTVKIVAPIVDDGSAYGYIAGNTYYPLGVAQNALGTDYSDSSAQGWSLLGSNKFTAVLADPPAISNFKVDTASTSQKTVLNADIDDGGLLTTVVLYLDTIQANLPSGGGIGATAQGYKTVSGGLTTISIDTTGLITGAVYWAEIKATNSEGSSYSGQITFTAK